MAQSAKQSAILVNVWFRFIGSSSIQKVFFLLFYFQFVRRFRFHLLHVQFFLRGEMWQMTDEPNQLPRVLLMAGSGPARQPDILTPF